MKDGSARKGDDVYRFLGGDGRPCILEVCNHLLKNFRYQNLSCRLLKFMCDVTLFSPLFYALPFQVILSH